MGGSERTAFVINVTSYVIVSRVCCETVYLIIGRLIYCMYTGIQFGMTSAVSFADCRVVFP